MWPETKRHQAKQEEEKRKPKKTKRVNVVCAQDPFPFALAQQVSQASILADVQGTLTEQNVLGMER